MKAKLFSLLLCLALVLALPALSQEAPAITMDESGLATWADVPGATGYEYMFVDGTYSGGEAMTTAEPAVQVPQGYAIHVRPVLADGSYGDWMVSAYLGTPFIPQADEEALEEPQPETDTIDHDLSIYMDAAFSTKRADLQTFELLSAIDPASIQHSGDTLTFQATGPDGIMRFACTGVTWQDGLLVFAPGSRLYGLDALGRICGISAAMANPGDENNMVWFSGGYTFSSATSVDGPESLYTLWGLSAYARDYRQASMEAAISLLSYQPNFITFGAEAGNTDAFTLSALELYYDRQTFTTGIRNVLLLEDMYGTYLEGDTYDANLEHFDLDSGLYDFYLAVQPDVTEELHPLTLDSTNLEMNLDMCVTGIDESLYAIGDLKDASGQPMDKASPLALGATLQVTIGDTTADVPLPIIQRFTGAQTLHDLAPYNNAAASGDVTALVVPVYWQDQPENATEDVLRQLKAQLGRVVDAAGQVTDYSDQLENAFSLSSYYDTASYNQYRITSFITDWYPAPYNYIGDRETVAQLEDADFPAQVYTWLMDTYPDMDWSRFDADADGFLDSVIIMNVGASQSGTMYMGTYGYAQFISPGYTGEGAGTPDKPALKNFVGLNASFLGSNTLIHEYGHSFGLVDYYDVYYTGIDALGGYDMQSSNMGDWNAYSKYAVGWIQPQVVTGLASGETAEVTLGSFATTGDALVLPAAGTGHDGPFGEYLLLELFTADGVNRYDAPAFGLAGAQGVRITHVDAAMERRVLSGAGGTEYPIGTVHLTNAYHAQGKYLLEVLQAGGVNTLTDLANLRPSLTADDLFAQGDTFTAEAYDGFLWQGRMDDGSALGYQVDILSIEQGADGPTATLRITRQ